MSGVYFVVPDLGATGGGGARFLQTLRNEFVRREQFAGTPESADVFLFNSHHAIDELTRLRRKFPGTPCVHRIDGPICEYNVKHDPRHAAATLANRFYADATIFQSYWSQERNMQAGIRPGPLSTVIHNAPDPAVFHPAEGYIPPSGNQKIRLVSTSWSVNPLKGFSSFVWLDENLDFSRFEVTLIGNCPERFRHVRVVPPLVHSALGDELRRHHLFFFPSRVECCSNALLEGLHCGLPALAFDGSSNRELVGEGGRMFARDEDIPGLLGEMSARLSEYRLRIAAMPLSRVAGAYASFLLETVPDALRGKRLKSAIWSKQVLFKGGVLLSKVRAKMS